MKTVRSFANEEEEAEVYLRKLQQVYKLNRKEAAAYMYYVWGSGVRAGRRLMWGVGCKAGESLHPGPWPRSPHAGVRPAQRSFQKRMQPLVCPLGTSAVSGAWVAGR